MQPFTGCSMTFSSAQVGPLTGPEHDDSFLAGFEGVALSLQASLQDVQGIETNVSELVSKM